MNLDELCNGLVYAQRQRVFCIKSQSRCDRSIEAFIATLLGFKTDQQESDRKKLFKMAATIRLKIENAGRDFDYLQFGEQIAGVAPMILRSAEARAGWDGHRTDIEGRMKEAAAALPAMPFVATVKGFSVLGLAVLVGEAGNFSNYSVPATLWKRFGLAVDDQGYRQGRLPPNLTREARAEAWTNRGYVPRRRAEVYAFVDDVMFRHQWRAEKTDDDTGEIIPAHPIGNYGEIYGRKKAEYLERALPAGHADKAARRYMAKCLIVDLWRAWKANAVVDVPVDRSLFYAKTRASESIPAAGHQTPETHVTSAGGGDAAFPEAAD